MTEPAGRAVPSATEVWSTGDYAGVCDRMIPDLGARLVELAAVRKGEEVLDVAAGSGNAALPAAQTGAAVTALDITPLLLEAGARRAAVAGVKVSWVHGDAQAMPFADGGFDCVLSCVGVQFCADQEAAARDLVRVCRPGGRIALLAWTPEGFIGQILAAVSRATGAGASRASPLEWGREPSVRARFETAGEMTMQRETVDMPGRSAAEWVDYMAEAYGPLARARGALVPRGEWPSLREQLCGIAAAHDTGGVDGFTGRAEYLVTVIAR